MSIRRALAGLTAAATSCLAITAIATATPATARGPSSTARLTPLAVSVPRTPAIFTGKRDTGTACILPDGSPVNFYHCYTPQQVRAAYGVDKVGALSTGPNLGQGQTIVLVDSYGSPTAVNDLQVFHDTFFANLPDPDFEQIFPLGNPQYGNVGNGNGQSGPSAAAGWSGEATLDIEWAYSIAPLAHIVLLAVPPAETLGVQGFPNLFKAISDEIDATPPGTVFSMSFAVTEQSFGGAAKVQTARFDKVFQKGLAKHDNFFGATGDTGTSNLSKQHRESVPYPYPTAEWPASSPYVVAVGGTQLQYGWTWNPASNDPSDPAYWQWNPGGDTQTVWNESWASIGTGGGVSVVYPQPSWQQGTAGASSAGRTIPDTSWNAAVNGGVDVYITAYPEYNCGNSTGCWTIFGGTSAATPQTAALVALVNSARADAGELPLGFLSPLLYQGVGASAAYSDVVPGHQGTAPKTFAGSEVGVSGTVLKSVGDLQDNQMWDVDTAGYPTTTGYDATTGWGTPNAPAFVAALAATP
jgi:subtilase family serine protease